MNERARKKLALALELDTQPTQTLLREIERVDSSIENTQKDIESIKDDSSKVIEAINELDQKKVDKTDLEYAISSVQTIKGDRGFKGEKGDPGRDGKDGRDGVDGKNGKDGKDGKNGLDGLNGKDGNIINGEEIIRKINKSEDKIDVERIEGIKSYDEEIKTLQNRTQLLNQIATTRSNAGASNFLSLTDTPSTYVGQALRATRVNAGETAIEFYTTTDTDEKVKYDAGDPAAGYVADKFVAGTGISLAEGTGANENKLVITNSSPNVAETASNLGAGAQVFKSKVGNDFQFRTIVSNSAGGVSVNQGTDEIELDLDISGLDSFSSVNIDNGDLMPFYNAASGVNESVSWSYLKTQLANNFVPYTGATADVNLGDYNLLAEGVVSHDSHGFYFKNQSLANVASFGLGGGQNWTFYDGVKLDSQTASRILSTDSSKNITALDTTTYPDLNELSYVKGVTSAIQTQLNSKLSSISGLDHNSLGNLTVGDVHTQYALLAGRSGGQTIIGGTAAGEDLTFRSTSHPTKGNIFFGNSTYDEVNNRLGIGTTAPDQALHVSSNSSVGTYVKIANTDTGGKQWALISTGSGNSGGAGKFGIYNVTDTIYRMYIDGLGNSGFGTIAPNAKIDLLTTAYDQLRLSYSTTQHTDFLVNSSGVLSIDPVGTSPAVVINEDGANADFRVEGDTDTNLLFIDASADSVNIGGTDSGAKLDLQGSFKVDSIVNDTGLAHGTYTPTLTNVTNVAASTAYSCQYTRVGNIVTVHGKVDIDQTSAGAYELGISLPIASNFATVTDLNGIGVSVNSVGISDSPYVEADTTNDRASFKGNDTDLGNHAHYFSFSYSVI